MDEKNYDCFDLNQVIEHIANGTHATPGQVGAAVKLLDDGNTIPFIARYRKAATKNLDEHALRAIEDALGRLHELAQRKSTILKTIDEQGKLDAELRNRFASCFDKKELEDLYLPFKPKRRTRVQDILAELAKPGRHPRNSINLVVRPWVKSSAYWPAKWDLTEKIKLGFDENGFSIPFPQQDVHIHQAAG